MTVQVRVIRKQLDKVIQAVKGFNSGPTSFLTAVFELIFILAFLQVCYYLVSLLHILKLLAVRGALSVHQS